MDMTNDCSRVLHVVVLLCDPPGPLSRRTRCYLVIMVHAEGEETDETELDDDPPNYPYISSPPQPHLRHEVIGVALVVDNGGGPSLALRYPWAEGPGGASLGGESAHHGSRMKKMYLYTFPGIFLFFVCFLWRSDHWNCVLEAP